MSSSGSWGARHVTARHDKNRTYTYLYVQHQTYIHNIVHTYLICNIGGRFDIRLGAIYLDISWRRMAFVLAPFTMLLSFALPFTIHVEVGQCRLNDAAVFVRCTIAPLVARFFLAARDVHVVGDIQRGRSAAQGQEAQGHGVHRCGRGGTGGLYHSHVQGALMLVTSILISRLLVFFQGFA